MKDVSDFYATSFGAILQNISLMDDFVNCDKEMKCKFCWGQIFPSGILRVVDEKYSSVLFI